MSRRSANASRAASAYLSVEEFGHALFRTGDLDPIYVMLREAHRQGNVSRDLLARYSLALWCYYHCGVAAWIASAKTNEAFYERMYKADERKYPRGGARRHFRGQLATTSIAWLAANIPDPSDCVDRAYGRVRDDDPKPYATIYERMGKWRGFGTWAIFKAADIVDAVFELPITFRGSQRYWPAEALQGAVLLDVLEERGREVALATCREADRGRLLRSATALAPRFLTLFREAKVPHAPHRRPRLQEIETVFCKYKAHVLGTYPVGRDTRDIAHEMKGWGTFAKQLRRFLP